MAKSQYPLDGKPGKHFKVTSKYGWRIHPISKAKKHHNGVDIWQAKEPSYIEAPFDGTVVATIRSTNPNSGGNQVYLQSKVMGKWVTSCFMHMVDGSIKVKKGQKVTAGTPLGKMGATGFATGKHLHWEIWDGKRTSQPNINSGGKGFYDPMKFVVAVMAWEDEQENLHAETPDPDAKPADPKPVTQVVTPPVTKPVAKPVTHTVKSGDTYWDLGNKYGVPYKTIQKLNKNAALHPGMKIRIK
jgi:murein DD-endopeptidase MepM/ murein hydrolase activator NlpD